MKIIFLLFFLLAASGASAQSLTWSSQQVCTDCKPVIGWYVDSLHGSWLFSRESLGWGNSYHYNYRTADGGKTWAQVNDSAGVFDHLKTQDMIDPVTTNDIYWIGNRQIYHSTDSGTTWKRDHMYPVQKAIWMNPDGTGLGISQEETDTGFTYQLHRTTDAGVYWYDTFGNSFESINRFSDAIHIEDSIFVVLCQQGKSSYTGAELYRTTDLGTSWQIVIRSSSDSLFPLQLNRVSESKTLLLEAVYALLVSFNGGLTWDSIPDHRGRKNYRTRGWQREGGPLVLFAAAGDIPANPSEQLLEPDEPTAFATELLMSLDTGRTWSAPLELGMPPGFKIGDLQIVQDKAIVVGYKDSASYVSTADLRPLRADVERHTSYPSYRVEIFPNPAGSASTLHLSFEGVNIQKMVVTDILGRLLAVQAVSPSDGHHIEIKQPFTPGVYCVFLTSNGSRVASTRFIVH